MRLSLRRSNDLQTDRTFTNTVPQLTQAGPRSFLDELSDVVSAGIATLIWAGDTDWLCNWYGVQDVVNQVTYSGQTAFRAKTLAPYKVNGKEKGQYKTEGNLSFLRVYDAGHEVMYYRMYLGRIDQGRPQLTIS